jgi:hypothetical protein
MYISLVTAAECQSRAQDLVKIAAGEGINQQRLEEAAATAAGDERLGLVLAKAQQLRVSSRVGA